MSDVPHEFLMAVAHADHILELQANLDRADMPPPWMWPFVKEMNAWIERVQREHKDRAKNPGVTEDEDMQENELLVRRG